MGTYNLALKSNSEDMRRFYDILLPFLTQQPLESSLVHAEDSAAAEPHAAPSKRYYGPWRRPQ
eukprot:3397923-Rhodomonas_salina.1